MSRKKLCHCPVPMHLSDNVDEVRLYSRQHLGDIRECRSAISFSRRRGSICVKVAHRDKIGALRPQIAPRMQVILRVEPTADERKPGRRA
jgi:hypothetical protein